MDKSKLEFLLEKLNGSGSDEEYQAVNELRKLGNEFPVYLLRKYRDSKKWKERSSCVHNSTRYAKESPQALELGLEALSDKSKHVRYLACLLLAWSLKKEVLPHLRARLVEETDDETLKDLKAAIDAIENQNSNYFVDRDHSGMVTLRVH
jgi:hypothetical protein